MCVFGWGKVKVFWEVEYNYSSLRENTNQINVCVLVLFSVVVIISSNLL